MQWRRAPVPLPYTFGTVDIGPRDSTALHPLTSAGRGLEPLERLNADADEPERKTSHVTRIMKDKAPEYPAVKPDLVCLVKAAWI